MKKETVGKQYRDVQEKRQESVTVFEMQQAMTEDYIPRLVAQVEDDKKKTDGDLFVEVITINDPIMPKIIKTYFKSRFTCPTPTYNQTVFHYDRKKDALFYVWTIPDLNTCNMLVEHEFNLMMTPEDRELLRFVIDFREGHLLRIAKELNHETEDDELIFYKKE